jgi:multidrug efflux pump subunit AcrA (membrane-fusion protein)
MPTQQYDQPTVEQPVRTPEQDPSHLIAAPHEKPKSRKILFFVIAGILVLMVLALAAGTIPRLATKHETQELAARRADSAPVVEVARVERAKNRGGLEIPGTTTPLTESAVYARSSGYLKKRYVDIGDHVKQGQLLAIVDAPDMDAQVDQARNQLSQAKAQLDQQKAQLALNKVTNDRYQALVGRGVISRQDGDQQQTNFQAQVANVAAAERNVEAFQSNLDRMTSLQGYERVTAPFSGVVTARNVDTGDLISAAGASGGTAPPTLASQNSSGSQSGASNSSGASGNGATLATPSTGSGNGGALFTISQSSRLRIYVSVPEAYAAQIHTGQKAPLAFQELPTQTFVAEVTRTAGAIDQNTRTMVVELQVDNSKGLLLPGMYAIVTFPVAPGSVGPLVVSGDAVAIRHDKPAVAVIKDGKVKVTPILIGRDLGNVVEIMSGLQDGDMIATSFTDDITDGAPVTTRMAKPQGSQK